MLSNIPQELRALPQWVCAGPDKVPINPRTGREADPSDPSTGGTFEDAVRAGYLHVGFILAADDPFTIIDLDDAKVKKVQGVTMPETDADLIKKVQTRHNKIYESFPSYTELSQSGEGVHIIIRGQVPRGFRRDKVEVYSDKRYMICTGKVLRNLAVNDCQPMLDVLAADMGRMFHPNGDLIEEDPIVSDEVIWRMGTKAANAEKFIHLCEGNWHLYPEYPSQSEADFALCSILAFYTRSNSQVIRMFRQTELGNRRKAERDEYFIGRYGILNKIRANEAPLVDMSRLLLTTGGPPDYEDPEDEAEDDQDEASAPPTPDIEFPPGLIGDVARYIFETSGRAVREISLAAALSFVAGIAGRSYSTSGQGLNQYIIVLAKTGRGKEELARGIERIMTTVKQRIVSAERFIGPATFASGPAMIRVLDEKPCFVSVMGEIGILLAQLCSENANDHNRTLMKVMLDVYGKSGPNQVLRSSVYSDSEKNTKIVQAPNLTILGESNPDTFYAKIDSTHILSGLLPRFTIFEYQGPRVRRNKTAYAPPSAALVDQIAGLLTIAIRTAEGNTCAPVREEPAATALLDAFDVEVDDLINSSGFEVESEIWSRAHLKALKFAALVAVGINPMGPVVTLEAAQWAIDLVRREAATTLKRFKSGDMGSGAGKQEAEIRRLFAKFQALPPSKRKKYRCPEALLDRQVLPYHYLNIYTRSLGAFRNDKRGESKALADCLQNMVKAEVFEIVPMGQAVAEFNTRSPIYYPGPAW